MRHLLRQGLRQHRLKVALAEYDRLIQQLLIAQALNVLGRMRVNILQALREFVLQTVNERYHTTTDRHKRAFAILVRLALDFVVIVIGLLKHQVS